MISLWLIFQFIKTFQYSLALFAGEVFMGPLWLHAFLWGSVGPHSNLDASSPLASLVLGDSSGWFLFFVGFILYYFSVSWRVSKGGRFGVYMPKDPFHHTSFFFFFEMTPGLKWASCLCTSEAAGAAGVCHSTWPHLFLIHGVAAYGIPAWKSFICLTFKDTTSLSSSLQD